MMQELHYSFFQEKTKGKHVVWVKVKRFQNDWILIVWKHGLHFELGVYHPITLFSIIFLYLLEVKPDNYKMIFSDNW